MSDIEIMEFPYGAFLKVRLEFVLLRDNELEAKIMRIIEGWMIDQKKEWMKACAQAASDGKPEPPEPDYFVTLSYAQIIAQLYMFNSSRKGEGKEVVEGKENSISRRTVSRAMQALIDDKVVFTRPNPNQTKEYDAAQYSLNRPLVQEQMKLLPKSPMSYLGSNGRINGDPCANLSHPPREMVSHPTRNNVTSPSENSAHGDVTNFPTLIDISNRDINSTEERTSSPENDSTQMGTPSPSSTPSSSLIANEPTKNVESKATRNASTGPITEPLDPSKRADILNPEEARVFDLLSEVFYAIPPEVITSKIKKQCAALAPHVRSSEDLRSLRDYARAQIDNDPNLTDKQIYLGNLIKAVNGWKQEQMPPPGKKPTASDPSKPFSASGLQNYSYNPPPEKLVAVPGFSLKALREQKMKERKNV